MTSVSAPRAHLPMISTCPVGQEEYVEYYDDIVEGWRVQYDYRHTDGKLFSCIAKTLESARARRDRWMTERGN